ncbi:MAG: hypothetical protein F6J95_015650 [Leptolyngbya sp. SIO1E4]|nr:hypothetical protein [Leptolyngbya sp. SIO1E4]
MIAPTRAALLVEDTIVDDTPQHRGSGRLTSQELPPESAIAYRGTGRQRNNDKANFAHRGSGRIDNDTTVSFDVAYRGSGRISPNLADHAQMA